VAALRHRTFFALEEINQALRELLHKLNQRGFKKREGSRASLFAAVDQPALQPLLATAYDLSQWCQAKVNIDYHVAFDGNFYSAPYPLVQEEVDVRSTPTTVEVLHKGQRVASHGHSRGHRLAITEREHRPKSHQAHLEWTPSQGQLESSYSEPSRKFLFCGLTLVRIQDHLCPFDLKIR
jgi:hypothetical protein